MLVDFKQTVSNDLAKHSHRIMKKQKKKLKAMEKKFAARAEKIRRRNCEYPRGC